MSAELPPWPARCEADNLAMFKWLNPKLDKLGIAKIWGEKESFEDEEDQTEIVFQLVKRRATKIRVSLPGAIEGAERGDIELLREVLVELAKEPRVGRFINLPKQKRGVRWPREREIFDRNRVDCFCETERIRWAADDVYRIRSLWCKRFGKKRRRQVDGWSAVYFAAMRWKVTDHQITNRLKKRSK